MLPIIVMVPKGQPLGLKHIDYSIPPSNKSYTRKRQLPFYDSSDIEIDFDEEEAKILEKELTPPPPPPEKKKSHRSDSSSRSVRSQSSKHSKKSLESESPAQKPKLIYDSMSVTSAKTVSSRQYNGPSVFSSDKTHTKVYKQQVAEDVEEVASLRKKRASSVKNIPMTYDPESKPASLSAKLNRLKDKTAESEAGRRHKSSSKNNQQLASKSPEKTENKDSSKNTKSEVPKMSNLNTQDPNTQEYVPGSVAPLRRRSRASSVRSTASSKKNDQNSEIPKVEFNTIQPEEPPARRKRSSSSTSRKKTENPQNNQENTNIISRDITIDSEKSSTPRSARTKKIKSPENDKKAEIPNDHPISEIPPTQRRRRRSSSIKPENSKEQQMPEVQSESPKRKQHSKDLAGSQTSSPQNSPTRRVKKVLKQPEPEIIKTVEPEKPHRKRKDNSPIQTIDPDYEPDIPKVNIRRSRNSKTNVPPLDAAPVEKPLVIQPRKRRRSSTTSTQELSQNSPKPVEEKSPKQESTEPKSPSSSHSKRSLKKKQVNSPDQEQKQDSKATKLELAAPEHQISIPVTPTPPPELDVSPSTTIVVVTNKEDKKEKVPAPELATMSTSPALQKSVEESEEEEETPYVNPYDELCKGPRPRRISADDLFFAILDDSD
ncbi:hypothetical protein TVAG_237750 [Trichomonas vaginalis G3]|uniref:Uncharacterized protein n=1 Tax=Trichomonas vaginalis (strain ATCC PRA-98 / G3) TaxID=412133 RepID=A2DCX5_TRIV3|nr:hypothetical protein TVAGG3_0606450 [Trichomonas vaginalis G3]EAY21749.1 hypothetical protein TVAG_237750 [Trichomonas vaginalis G3]KAI5524276.1 hypothetical protein TVAGG3_0606450 [Trichomonas vaginalis G3]|eukprot:XP_001582735.1 hypothetical protein [Trichomonas vaginalis G3]